MALVAAPLACALETNGLGGRDDSTDASTVGRDAANAGDGATSADANGAHDVTAFAETSAADVVVAPLDAAPDVDAGDICDKDGDGHRETGNICFGDDCCDTDNQVHPGQSAWFATPGACGSFDYDCDGTLEKESGTVSCKLGFFTCSGDGFAAATACGVIASYTTCGYSVFSCSQNNDMRAQRCH